MSASETRCVTLTGWDGKGMAAVEKMEHSPFTYTHCRISVAVF